jgi:hypothetical protein
MSDDSAKPEAPRKSTPKLRVHLDLEGETPREIERHLQKIAGRKGRRNKRPDLQKVRQLKRKFRRRVGRR